jgi:hypothetical protein
MLLFLLTDPKRSPAPLGKGKNRTSSPTGAVWHPFILHKYKKRRPAENLTRVGQNSAKILPIARPEDGKIGP